MSSSWLKDSVPRDAAAHFRSDGECPVGDLSFEFHFSEQRRRSEDHSSAESEEYSHGDEPSVTLDCLNEFTSSGDLLVTYRDKGAAGRGRGGLRGVRSGSKLDSFVMREKEGEGEAEEAEDEEEEEGEEEEDVGALPVRRKKVTKDDFDLLRMVGRGAYARVYQARMRSTGAVYAIKVFRKDFLLDSNSVESTRFERDVLLRLRHPFVVRLRYAFQNEARLYFVMDYLVGK